jgi:hypothetical protein
MTGGGLGAFVPETIRVDLRDRVVDIKPLTVGQLPAFSRAVTPILPALLSGQIMPALMAEPEALVSAVAVSTGLDPSDLRAMDPVDFVALAQAVIEVNVDFFARRLLPATRAAEQAILAQMVALAPPDGDLSLPGSANAGTG